MDEKIKIEKSEEISTKEEQKGETKPWETSKSEPSPRVKKQFKVLNVIGEELILLDEKNNGVRISTPREFKNIKIGDVIYL